MPKRSGNRHSKGRPQSKSKHPASTKRIWIYNLPPNVLTILSKATSKTIHGLLDFIGTVKEIYFCMKRELYAFVEMSSVLEAGTAIHFYNKANIEGRTLHVRAAYPKAGWRSYR